MNDDDDDDDASVERDFLELVGRSKNTVVTSVSTAAKVVTEDDPTTQPMEDDLVVDEASIPAAQEIATTLDVTPPSIPPPSLPLPPPPPPPPVVVPPQTTKADEEAFCDSGWIVTAKNSRNSDGEAFTLHAVREALMNTVGVDDDDDAKSEALSLEIFSSSKKEAEQMCEALTNARRYVDRVKRVDFKWNEETNDSFLYGGMQQKHTELVFPGPALRAFVVSMYDSRSAPEQFAEKLAQHNRERADINSNGGGGKRRRRKQNGTQNDDPDPLAEALRACDWVQEVHVANMRRLAARFRGRRAEAVFTVLANTATFLLVDTSHVAKETLQEEPVLSMLDGERVTANDADFFYFTTSAPLSTSTASSSSAAEEKTDESRPRVFVVHKRWSPHVWAFVCFARFLDVLVDECTTMLERYAKSIEASVSTTANNNNDKHRRLLCNTHVDAFCRRVAWHYLCVLDALDKALVLDE
jgi:hypothetical protein